MSSLLTRSFGHGPMTGVASSKASPLIVLSLVLSTAGCETDGSVKPTPSATVRIDGRVVDEHHQPVGGAKVTLTYIVPFGRPEDIQMAPSIATADGSGSFTLTMTVPAQWEAVTLRADAAGFESHDRIFVEATETGRAVLINLYRSLTISPGAVIPTTVSLGSFTCGFALQPCRRATVHSPSGQPVDIEVIPAEGQKYAGLALEEHVSLGSDFPSQLTVPHGDAVWIVVSQFGRVTLKAHSR